MKSITNLSSSEGREIKAFVKRYYDKEKEPDIAFLEVEALGIEVFHNEQQIRYLYYLLGVTVFCHRNGKHIPLP